MYNFKVTINDLETKAIFSIADLAKELNDMQAANEVRFSFEPDPVFWDLERFWLIKIPKKKGVFKKKLVFNYYLELNFKYPDGRSGLCGYNSDSFDELEVMITNLINHQKLPDFSSWVMTIRDKDGKAISLLDPNPNWRD